MEPELLCPLRAARCTSACGIDAGPAVDVNNAPVWGPCIRGKCAWWCWSNKPLDEGACAMLGANAVAYYISQGACRGGA